MSFWHDDRVERDYGAGGGGGGGVRGRGTSSYQPNIRERRRSPPRGGAPPGRAPPECRVYVQNLSYKTSWQDLKDYMRSAGGNVEYVKIFEDESGRSKGNGVVEFATAEDALAAIDSLNETDLDGRNVGLRLDRDAEGGGGGDGGGGGGGGGGYSRGDRGGGGRYAEREPRSGGGPGSRGRRGDDGPRRERGGGRGGGDRRRGGDRAVKSEAELDAEMEEYRRQGGKPAAAEGTEDMAE